MRERTIYTRWRMVDLGWRNRGIREKHYACDKDIPEFGYRCELVMYGDELIGGTTGYGTVKTIACSYGADSSGGDREGPEQWIEEEHKMLDRHDRMYRRERLKRERLRKRGGQDGNVGPG